MHHLVRHHIHNSKYLERNEMYWAMSFKTFALSLVGVFVPAYLYKLGYSIRVIIVYFLIRELVELLLVYPTTAMMIRLGIKRTFTVGCFMTLVNLGLLYALPSYRAVFVIAAVSEALAISLFFLPFHFMFSSAITKRGAGSQVGLMDIMVSSLSALGPLLGGLIAARYGLRQALLLALIFVVIAIGPILRGTERTKLGPLRYSLSLKILFSKDSLSNMGFGVTEMVATIIWPLFIFILIKSYATVGLIVSASLLLVVVLDFVVGRFTDKGKVWQLLKVGAISSAAIHLLRIIASPIAGIAALNFASDASHTLFRVPWTAEFYRHAGKSDRKAYIASMELAVCLGRTVLWAAIVAASYIVSARTLFLFAFGLGAIGSLYIPKISTAARQ